MNVAMTEKGKKFSDWAQRAIRLIRTVQAADEELAQYASMTDEYDGDFLRCVTEDTARRRRDAQLRLAKYRLTISELIAQMDLEKYTPSVALGARKVAHLRYYRGLPFESEYTNQTVANLTHYTHSYVFALNVIAVNAIAEHWDENTPEI